MRRTGHDRIKTIRTDRRPETGGLTGGVRDAGLYVRSPAGGAAQRRSALPVVALIAAALLLALFAAAYTSRDTAAPQAAVPATAAAGAATATVDATPVFATCDALELRSPIAPDAITALAFHQASGNKSLHMTSLVPDADMKRADELKAVPPTDASTNAAGSGAQMPGSCLRLWRSNRSGKPDTAADVGAEPGTPVVSPVSGTVLEVKAYKLYDKYDDFEIHIQPDGMAEVDVVLIHIADPCVSAGQHVDAGITRLAVVRKMSDKIDIQLGGYTNNGGDHVHVQLNRVETSGVLQETDGS